MNCKKCGSLLAENDLFCKGCGAPVQNGNEQIVNPDMSGEVVNNVGGVQNTVVPPVVSEQPVFQQPVEQPQQVVQSTSVEQPAWQNSYNATTNPVQQQVVQPTYGQQPAWQGGYNAQPNFNPTQNKNNGNGKFIIIGIAIAIVIVLAIILVGVLSGGDDSTNGGIANSGGSSQTVGNNAYKVNFRGFTLNIPDDLIYEQENDNLLVGNKAGTWVAQFEIEEGSFSQLKANKAQLQPALQNSGLECSAAEIKTFGGVEFITLEMKVSGQNVLFVMAKANSMYFFGAAVINRNNTYDYSVLEELAPIVSSAVYNNTTTNMEANNYFNFDVVSQYAK